MKIEEPGVIGRDGIYFWSASNFSKEKLFYPMWGAVYDLDVPYRIRRNYMDAYMLQYIVSGNLKFKLRGETFTAGSGELVLLSCKESNDYWSECPAKVKWFHFNGSGVSTLLEYIYEKNGNGHMSRFLGEQTIGYVDQILQGLRTGAFNEFHFSKEIYSLLCTLAEQPSNQETISEQAVRRAVSYMKEHYAEPLSVQQIASAVNLSPYYFTRMFKRIMMTSPHLFLLNFRLDEAKKMLVYTNRKIEFIADVTGVQNSSYFVRVFHREMNMTPKVFRNYFSSTADKNRK